MNFLNQWISICKIYFNSKYSIYSGIFSILIISLINSGFAINNLSSNLYSYIFQSFINPLLIYISMIFVLISLISPKNYKKNIISLKSGLIASWWIILLKILWNLSNFIIMGIDYSPCTNISMFPSMILFFTWIIILLTAIYYIPKKIIKDEKEKISFNAFLNFFTKTFWKLFLFIILSIFTSFLIICIFAYLFSIIISNTPNFINIINLKIFFEKTLETIGLISYSHLLTTIAFYLNYNQKNKK